mmetsp:Transcript_100237/g.198802  ORF Transcript_100237/g.198802 Transcript_100237/m.198802 type:complete len:166 (-) Transcript_100237:410-907(-)
MSTAPWTWQNLVSTSSAQLESLANLVFPTPETLVRAARATPIATGNTLTCGFGSNISHATKATRGKRGKRGNRDIRRSNSNSSGTCGMLAAPVLLDLNTFHRVSKLSKDSLVAAFMNPLCCYVFEPTLHWAAPVLQPLIAPGWAAVLARQQIVPKQCTASIRLHV